MLSEKLKSKLSALLEIAWRGLNSDIAHEKFEAEQALRTARSICAKYNEDFDNLFAKRANSYSQDTIGMGKIEYTYAEVMSVEAWKIFCSALSNIVSCRVVFQGSTCIVCGEENDYEAFRLMVDTFIGKLELFFSNSKAKEKTTYGLGFAHGLLEFSQKQGDASAPYEVRGDELVVISNKLARIDTSLARLNTTSAKVNAKEQAEEAIPSNPKDLLSYLKGKHDGQHNKTRL